MNIVLKLDQFQIDYVQFLKTRKNIVMENSLFIKLLYSDGNMVMNSVYVEFPVVCRETTRNMIFYNVEENESVIRRFAQMERDILAYYKVVSRSDKIQVYAMQTQLEKGLFKYNYVYNSSAPNVTESSRMNCVMKISGIWENKDAVGINYKLFFMPQLIRI